jgi:serine protease AprX
VRLERFTTAQRELLAAVLGGSVGVAPSRPFCRRCLVALDRRVQSRQLVRDGDELFYVDRLLTPYPIMPTPMRLGANDELRGRGVTICFIDSGFVAHPDFLLPTSRILAVYDAVRGRRLATTTQRGEPSVAAWHGTMTAASAAGSGVLSGGLYRGVASEAKLVFVATMTPWGGIHTPQVVRALKWVARNRERYDIRIINMSLGVDEVATSLDHPVIELIEELVAAGIVVIAAAGNGPDEPIVPPAAAPSAITVGGYDDRNTTDPRHWGIWWGSSGTTIEGSHKPELLAPSVWLAAPILQNTPVKREADALFALAAADDRELMKSIPRLARDTMVSTALRSTTSSRLARSIVLRRIHDEKLITAHYKHVDGTSFAAPLVSSIVAQMLEARPTLQPADVRDILLSTAVRLHEIPAERQGSGVVRAAEAVALARR